MYGSAEQREYYLKRREVLRNERSSVMEMYRQLADHVLPRRTKEFITEQPKGGSQRQQPQLNDKLIDGTPRWAVRTLAQGMMSGITSPARKWFKLTLSEPELAENSECKEWLAEVEERMREYFARSNIYTALYLAYEDLAAFGTAVMFVEEDEYDLFRAYVWPAGQYYLANSSRMAVQTLYRDVSMTVEQVVEYFGIENVSKDVAQKYQEKHLDTQVDLLHVVEPRREWSPEYAVRDQLSRPWKACWLEVGVDGQKGKDGEKHGFLREDGYFEQPMMCPRWATVGEHVYGNGPGLDALGTCRQLQFVAAREAMVVDKLANPPLMGPASLNHRRVSQLPGDYVPVPATAANQKVEPLLRIDGQALPAIRTMRGDIRREVERIMYADLFRSFPTFEDSGQPRTAQEIRAREQEKMLQLGATMERLEDEALDPFMERCVGIALRSGRLPPMPQVLQERGGTLRVEFLSILTQAQKLIGVSAMREYTAYVLELSQFDKTALHTIDSLEAAKLFADAVGAPPAMVRPPDEVRELIAADAERAMRAEQMQEQMAAAETAKALGTVDLSRDTALGRLADAYNPASQEAA